LKNALIFLVEAHLRPVLDNFSEIGHYKVNFHNICAELCRIGVEAVMTLKQKIIELVRLSTAKSIRDIGFSFSWISVMNGV